MSTMTSILVALALSFFIFITYKNLKSNPEWLSKANLSKSFTTMGILALILIVFVGFLVLLARAA